MSYLLPLTTKFEGGRFLSVVVALDTEANEIARALDLLKTTRVARRGSLFLDTMPACFNEDVLRYVNNNLDKGYQYDPKMYVVELIIETTLSMKDVNRGMCTILKNVLGFRPTGPCIILPCKCKEF
jgi:hypothetical protein